VTLTVDGTASFNLGAANVNRPDVGAAYPASGPNHGYDKVVAYATPGTHQVCAKALNAAGLGLTVELGCKTVTM
jgi:hypothetical protein